MALWRRMEKQFEAGTAPHCYARQILEQKDSWYSSGLNDEDLAWVAGGLVEAGFETTGVALNSLVLYLAANPRVQERAHEELMRAVGPDRLPTFADMHTLPYVRACVKEVLRINPMLIPGVRHYADADVVYKHHVIPKGTVLVTNTSFLHFDPTRYENPFDFTPERFLDHRLYSSEYAAMSDPYARDHFTFSTGRRVCPGARLAENSLDIALACILWAFEIRPPVVNGVEVKVGTGDSEFFPGPFHIPKPFAARFIPRDAARLRSVKEQWDIAQRDGYDLRGVQVDVDGVVKDH
ncbi:cytochrome P450 CYP2 subfamily [Podospora appendiculata]|uniref:Cytochrome P450 CYP2 subfamily n=1 Tax=Podospora appendiculata TaxID=314037 RepID=A0AAE0XDA2_9PEZI|nr:cytochrome P450 CYP2 subfamily [Podospora appendiculata]